MLSKQSPEQKDVIEGVMALKWGHSWPLTLLWLTRTTTIHGRDPIERILEDGGEAEAPPCTAETKTDARDGEEEQLHATCHLQASAAPD